MKAEDKELKDLERLSALLDGESSIRKAIWPGHSLIPPAPCGFDSTDNCAPW